MNHIHIYTDGAFTKRAGGVAGWGFYATQELATVTRGGYELNSSSDRAELLALYNSLKSLKEGVAPVKIFSDSKYCETVINNASNWKRRAWKNSSGDVKNLDLVRKILNLHETHSKTRVVSVAHVKGHSGNVGNEFADFIAVKHKEIGVLSVISRDWDSSEDFDAKKILKELKIG